QIQGSLQAMSKLPLRAQTVDIAYLPLRQGFFGKNALMTAQRDYGLGNSLFTLDIFRDLTSPLATIPSSSKNSPPPFCY
ncbi:MAG: hypothetical protein ACFFCW_48975, partial [Candidatus Hodarchaeota archaeon]